MVEKKAPAGRSTSRRTLGFRVPVSGFRVPGFGKRISGFGLRVSGFGFWVSSFGFRVSGSRFRVPGFGSRVSGIGVSLPRPPNVVVQCAHRIGGSMYVCTTTWQPGDFRKQSTKTMPLQSAGRFGKHMTKPSRKCEQVWRRPLSRTQGFTADPVYGRAKCSPTLGSLKTEGTKKWDFMTVIRDSYGIGNGISGDLSHKIPS